LGILDDNLKMSSARDENVEQRLSRAKSRSFCRSKSMSSISAIPACYMFNDTVDPKTERKILQSFARGSNNNEEDSQKLKSIVEQLWEAKNSKQLQGGSVTNVSTESAYEKTTLVISSTASSQTNEDRTQEQTLDVKNIKPLRTFKMSTWLAVERGKDHDPIFESRLNSNREDVPVNTAASSINPEESSGPLDPNRSKNSGESVLSAQSHISSVEEENENEDDAELPGLVPVSEVEWHFDDPTSMMSSQDTFPDEDLDLNIDVLITSRQAEKDSLDDSLTLFDNLYSRQNNSPEYEASGMKREHSAENLILELMDTSRKSMDVSRKTAKSCPDRCLNDHDEYHLNATENDSISSDVSSEYDFTPNIASIFNGAKPGRTHSFGENPSLKPFRESKPSFPARSLTNTLSIPLQRQNSENIISSVVSQPASETVKRRTSWSRLDDEDSPGDVSYLTRESSLRSISTFDSQDSILEVQDEVDDKILNSELVGSRRPKHGKSSSESAQDPIQNKALSRPPPVSIGTDALVRDDCPGRSRTSTRNSSDSTMDENMTALSASSGKFHSSSERTKRSMHNRISLLRNQISSENEPTSPYDSSRNLSKSTTIEQKSVRRKPRYVDESSMNAAEDRSISSPKSISSSSSRNSKSRSLRKKKSESNRLNSSTTEEGPLSSSPSPSRRRKSRSGRSRTRKQRSFAEQSPGHPIESPSACPTTSAPSRTSSKSKSSLKSSKSRVRKSKPSGSNSGMKEQSSQRKLKSMGPSNMTSITVELSSSPSTISPSPRKPRRRLNLTMAGRTRSGGSTSSMKMQSSRRKLESVGTVSTISNKQELVGESYTYFEQQKSFDPGSKKQYIASPAELSSPSSKSLPSQRISRPRSSSKRSMPRKEKSIGNMTKHSSLKNNKEEVGDKSYFRSEYSGLVVDRRSSMMRRHKSVGLLECSPSIDDPLSPESSPLLSVFNSSRASISSINDEILNTISPNGGEVDLSLLSDGVGFSPRSPPLASIGSRNLSRFSSLMSENDESRARRGSRREKFNKSRSSRAVLDISSQKTLFENLYGPRKDSPGGNSGAVYTGRAHSASPENRPSDAPHRKSRKKKKFPE